VIARPAPGRLQASRRIVAIVPEPEMASTAHSTLEVTPRHLWLALLGTAGLARRSLVSGLCAASTRAQRAGKALRGGAEDAGDIALGALLTVQEKLARKPRRRATARRRVRRA
jgi:hypothetical protein